MSQPNTTPLESYVRAYLKQNTRGRTLKTQFIEKALALVDEKLGIPCCIDPSSSVNLVTRFENDFTNTVRMMLTPLSKKGNVQELNRVHRLLYKFLNPPCCVA